jgi:predicted transcriptional regulator
MLKVSRNRFYSVPVVMRTLDVLEYLHRCESQVKTNEISDNLRVPRTTTYRILRTLVHRGYVIQDLDGRFSLSHSGTMFASNRYDGKVVTPVEDENVKQSCPQIKSSKSSSFSCEN